MFWILWFALSLWSMYISLKLNIDWDDEASNVLWFLMILFSGPFIGFILLSTRE